MPRLVKTVVRTAATAATLWAAFNYGGEVNALPMFTRKLGVSCATCHTSPPRLNETGYRFRAAGFRFPSRIGKEDEKPFNFFDYNSIRAQGRYDASRTEAGASETTRNEWTLQAVEFYPFTGAWGKYFSTNFKFTAAPDKRVEIESAHVKVNVGNSRQFFSARAGIFHPYDGFGAADSPATVSRPLIQTATANLDQNTFFRTWGFDQAGAEVGYDYRRTSVRLAVTNGLVLHEEKGRLTAFAAQGGPLTRSSTLPAHDGVDVQLFVNQALHANGGAVSFHYYHGNLALPLAAGNSLRNTFDRAAIYGSYPVAKRLQLYAGFQHGRDGTATQGRFSSRGAFVEAAVPIHELSMAGVRCDWFDPARRRPENEVRAVTAYVNAWFFSQFRVVAEYQRRHTARGLAPAQKDDAFQMRLIYIK
jgi:hypothetical protein